LPTLLLLGTFLLSAGIDITNLLNYQDQEIPAYINQDNTGNNDITDAGATLGRVLFYDKNLSVDVSTSCASCHQQQFAFGDTNLVSIGANGLTGRHSMRLVNARFAEERRFFWDERAQNLEVQTTQPIQDHAEMGFSGMNGNPSLIDLIERMEGISYYPELFTLAFGDAIITENRMQQAIAQFVRSIQSFDSKYDEGRAMAPNDGGNFSNFTASENRGKNLFMTPPQRDPNGVRISGGAGCGGCHRAPEFDIDPNSGSNGVLVSAGSNELDARITRSPSLRDMVNPDGVLNGNLMHTAAFGSLEEVLDHYDNIAQSPQFRPGASIDPRLRPGGNFQVLNLTDTEKEDLVAFLETLTGSDMYTNEKWADPFDENGNLELTGIATSLAEELTASVRFYPNPTQDFLFVEVGSGTYSLQVFDLSGALLTNKIGQGSMLSVDMSTFVSGVYVLRVMDDEENLLVNEKVVKL
ncbi:MAG: cytochrome c peroxidase, partial [Bacteroidota bacterium]